MLQLYFNDFWKKMEFAIKEHRYATMHYLEQDGIIFIFKSNEQWDYYTYVSTEDINSFAEQHDVPFEEAYNDFKINYCSNATKLKPDEFSFDFTHTILNRSNVVKGADPEDVDIVDESEDYAEYMKGIMIKMEKKVVAALKHIHIEKSAEQIDKTFGEFLRVLMNNVNMLPFISKIKMFVKSGLTVGLESAEAELDMDIGFTGMFGDKVKNLAHQQLNGYTLPDGKAWHGIKGASQELRIKILRSVQEDVINKESRTEMTKNIQEIFRGSGWSQAVRIARTESNRFINEGKLTGYVESGIEGHKAYASVGDNDVSPICERLHSKYFAKGIPFDVDFVDDKSGKRGPNPPFAHPNCRCSIEYRKAT